MTLPFGPEEARLAAEIRQEPPLAVFQKIKLPRQYEYPPRAKRR